MIPESSVWDINLIMIVGKLDRPLRVEDMAGRAGMSPRTFNRILAPCTGTTPARFLEQARC